MRCPENVSAGIWLRAVRVPGPQPWLSGICWSVEGTDPPWQAASERELPPLGTKTREPGLRGAERRQALAPQVNRRKRLTITASSPAAHAVPDHTRTDFRTT